MIETHRFIYKRVCYIVTKNLKCRHVKAQHEINKNMVVLRKKMKLWDGLGKKIIRNLGNTSHEAAQVVIAINGNCGHKLCRRGQSVVAFLVLHNQDRK